MEKEKEAGKSQGNPAPPAADDSATQGLFAREVIKKWDPYAIEAIPSSWIMFSRRFLSKFLGGSEQAQECVVSESKLTIPSFFFFLFFLIVANTNAPVERRSNQLHPVSVYYCKLTHP